MNGNRVKNYFVTDIDKFKDVLIRNLIKNDIDYVPSNDNSGDSKGQSDAKTETETEETTEE